MGTIPNINIQKPDNMYSPGFDMLYQHNERREQKRTSAPVHDDVSVDRTELLAHLPVSCETHGHKRGRVLRRWHARFLVIKGSFLLVYKVAKQGRSREPSNVVDLRNATFTNSGDISSCKKERTFTVDTPSHRPLNLSVPASVFKQFWAALARASSRRHGPSLKDFKTLKKIGTGGTASVFLVRHKTTGQLHAMKRILKRGNMEHIDKRYRGLANARRRVEAIAAQLTRNVAHLCEERSAYEALNHPNIMQLDYAFQDDEAWYFVSKYYSGGNLYKLLKKQPNRRFQEDVVRHWAAQLVSMLEHTHSKQYLHRDLKPENVLLDEQGNLNLIDFGFAKRLEKHTRTKTFCGTKYYIAPEMIRGNHAHGHAVDWWAMGIMIFELLTGYPPFPDKELPTLYDKIINTPFEFSAEQEAKFSPEVRSLVENLLIKEAWNRLGARDVDYESKDGMSEIRSHPFFTGVDWAAIDAGTASVPFALCTSGNCAAKSSEEGRSAFVVWQQPAPAGDKAVDASNEDDDDSADESQSRHSSAFLRLDGFSFCYDDTEHKQDSSRARDSGASTDVSSDSTSEDPVKTNKGVFGDLILLST